jgi:hypothetical protein
MFLPVTIRSTLEYKTNVVDINRNQISQVDKIQH